MASAVRGGRAMSGWFAAAAAQPTRACTQCARARGAPLVRGAASCARPWPSQRRSYSADAAAAAVDPSTSTSTSAEPPAAPAARTPPDYRIRAGLVLSRPPLLTREPTPFEAAFYLYQKRLNERLTGSFRRNVYFKPDTTAALDWRLQMRERRGTPARDIGQYAGGKGGGGVGGARAWDDELTADDPEAAALTDPARLRERILSDADLRVSDDGQPLAEADRVPVERPQPRTTAADAANDTTRLDRKLDRTLYLVVRGADGAWLFPTADVQTNENLHESAAGVDMNTWIVGRVPVAHLVRAVPETPASEPGAPPIRSEKTFFLKGRIMAGQANLEGNTLGVSAFRWLTKEELAAELPPSYYASVKNSMPER